MSLEGSLTVRQELPCGLTVVGGVGGHARHYLQYHARRITKTLEKLAQIGTKRIVEVGGHPWAMTAAIIDDPHLELVATVSAEEVTNWPDDISVAVKTNRITTPRGKRVDAVSYSANVERTLFDLEQSPDTVIACEIVEHLIRAPHVMFLNINRWLPDSGKLLVTTPNGAQFANPFRRRSPTPAYRCSVYERHSYLFTLNDLVDLVALCGFEVLEVGYWDVYDRRGPARVYDLLSKLPWRYLKDKFKQTIYLVGEKRRRVTELERAPSVYDPRGKWEFVRAPLEWHSTDGR